MNIQEMEDRIANRVIKQLTAVFSMPLTAVFKPMKQAEPEVLPTPKAKSMSVEKALDQLLNMKLKGKSILRWLEISCGFIGIHEMQEAQKILIKNGIRKSCTRVNDENPERERFLVINTRKLPKTWDQKMIEVLSKNGEKTIWSARPNTGMKTTFRINLKHHPKLQKLGEETFYNWWDIIRISCTKGMSLDEKRSWIESNKCWFL